MFFEEINAFESTSTLKQVIACDNTIGAFLLLKDGT